MKYLLPLLVGGLLTACVDVPRYDEVTSLDDGILVVSRDSLTPFDSGTAAEEAAKSYCDNLQQHYQLVDREERYVNSTSSAGDVAHRVVLQFRCTDTVAPDTSPSTATAVPAQ